MSLVVMMAPVRYLTPPSKHARVPTLYICHLLHTTSYIPPPTHHLLHTTSYTPPTTCRALTCRAYMHACIRACVHMHAPRGWQEAPSIHVYVHVYACMCMRGWREAPSVYTRIHMHAYTCTHTHARIHMHTYTCTHTHTHIHIHTRHTHVDLCMCMHMHMAGGLECALCLCATLGRQPSCA